jgi:hypothetical protein
MTPAENIALENSDHQKGLRKKAIPFQLHQEIATYCDAERPHLIKGVMNWGETSAWIAPPGGMKSALMAEAAICVARGTDWHGRKVKKPAGVVYFALERSDLVRRRIMAHTARLGLAEGENLPIALVSQLVDLMNPASVPLVCNTIEAAGHCFNQSCGVGLIIFDTFAKLIAAGGGDENTAKDQGRLFANLQRIKDRTPAHVALVGHTGKDVERGARGSNAFLGDVDVMVTISGNEIKTATVTKANDMPEGPLFSFKSEVHEFGTDEDGDPITVNIVSSEQLTPAKPTSREPKLTANQRTVFSILHASGSSGLSLEDWNAQAKEAGIGLGRKADLTDIRNALLSKGMVRRYGDRWTVHHA